MKPIPPLLPRRPSPARRSLERPGRQPAPGPTAAQPIVYQLMVFVMAIFVGYYVVWSVTPALHTRL